MEPVEFKRKGISEQVADHIKKRIMNKEYQPGDKIPGEREMATQLEVSRNTVREAYKILEAYGYLVIKHGTGIFIAAEDEQIRKMTSFFFVSEDHIKDLFAIRNILEINAVEWAVNRASEEQMSQLERIVERAESVITEETDYDELSNLDHEFHLNLATISDNIVLVRVMHNLIDLLHETRFQSNKIEGRARKSVKEHREIVQAMKDKDPSKARDKMKYHLESVENSITSHLTEEER
ncbi:MULTISPECIES: FadR/GntR family transcriptional regulator [Pontibacillus]|uniref:FadR/GntR family transcriptional regulator n=1 Tax=Pontibacillus chungwhensis TaxID=265426 RepID=A0ABY8UYL8_9BACI|nr:MULTISPECIES: FadR/GntR family transcriptional regulator [Pontibacillus]MCD5325247.1 FadR family transcriptional regulator [Pontibacillus sp. HN14]WIF97495.1 FadR/GntR family transcriptional regulator [Pontibacillus chungwhensis]